MISLKSLHQHPLRRPLAWGMLVGEHFILRTHAILTLERLLYGIGVGALALFLAVRANLTTYDEARMPIFTTGRHGAWLLHERPNDANTKRFFRTSTPRFFDAATSEGSIEILDVACGDDIHEIHPPSICLQSGGWHVLSEQPRSVTLGSRPFAHTELRLERSGSSLLVLYWYSNPDLSTGTFLGFRRHAHAHPQGWHAYQLATPVLHDDVDAARSRLMNLIEAFETNFYLRVALVSNPIP